MKIIFLFTCTGSFRQFIILFQPNLRIVARIIKNYLLLSL